MLNKIVFTSPEAMVEFSGGKARQNLFEHMQIISSFERSIVSRSDLFSFELGKQKSPITNHTTTLCKECEIKSLTTQALSQL